MENFMTTKIMLALWLIINLLSCPGCTKAEDQEIATTDYAMAQHWLSMPAPVLNVDVFYVYPTVWKKTSDDDNICKIDNASMLAGSLSAFDRQATLFSQVANIYAPFYRQADTKYVLSLPEQERWDYISGIPSRDVIAAFDYYINHFNNGRPFILAGHSQGANCLLFLLSEYMQEHPDVYNRMIAAYVIGYPVTQEFLDTNPHLKFAEGPDDTGVIISYNTQAPDVAAGANPVVSDIIGLVINPISWTRGETDAPASLSLGSLMPDASLKMGKVEHYADARVDISRGVLICSTANEDALMPLTSAFGRGVYHSFDYPFYYYDLQANAANRISKYLEN
jgi:hypothetical protein